MADPFKADTQYGDMKGSIAIDGWEAFPIEELADDIVIPDGYEIVGFSIAGTLAFKDNGWVSLDLAAVDTNEVGMGAEQWIEFARDHGALPTYRIPARISGNSLLSRIKRLEICVLPGIIHDADIEVTISSR